MARRPAKQPASYVFMAVIFIAVLIDAILLAIVHENYVHDHGYDVRPQHLAVAKPAPP
jgi:membrane protein YdbS with pleckstrin-like domain